MMREAARIAPGRCRACRPSSASPRPRRAISPRPSAPIARRSGSIPASSPPISSSACCSRISTGSTISTALMAEAAAASAGARLHPGLGAAPAGPVRRSAAAGRGGARPRSIRCAAPNCSPSSSDRLGDAPTRLRRLRRDEPGRASPRGRARRARPIATRSPPRAALLTPGPGRRLDPGRARPRAAGAGLHRRLPALGHDPARHVADEPAGSARARGDAAGRRGRGDARRQERLGRADLGRGECAAPPLFRSARRSRRRRRARPWSTNIRCTWRGCR